MEQPHHCSHHHLVFHSASVSSPRTHHHHHHCHHHHVIMPKCALHNNFPQNPNSKICTHLITPLPQIPKPPASTNPILGSSGFQPPPTSQNTQNFQDDVVGEYEEDEEEDPVFVMTDEWRDFFAKSEAKRREAKKLAKKQGKKQLQL